MVDSLILLLFLISGAATGWLGVDLLPENLLQQVTNLEGLRTVLAGFGVTYLVVAWVMGSAEAARWLRLPVRKAGV